MALWDEVTGWVWPTGLYVVGAALLAPIIVPPVLGMLRPVAKMAVKGSLCVIDSVKEVVAEAGEQVSDLVAEARAEYSEAAPSGEPSTAEAV